MSEHHGGYDGEDRPLPPRPPAPPSYGSSQAADRGYGNQGYGQSGYTDPNSTYGTGQYGSGSQGSGGQGYGSPGSGSWHTPEQAKPAKKFGAGALVTGMVLAGLLGGGVAVGANTLMDGNTTSSGGSGQPQTVVVNNEDSVSAVTAAAVKASPSVVTIEVSGGGSTGTGSGIIIDDDGNILTNTHVVTLGGTVADPAVEVQTSDGRVLNATVVGTDPVSDLAVINVSGSDLTPATLGSSDDLNVGDTVIAIGAPLGLSGTVTDGIVSTLNRTISVQSSAAPESDADDPQGEDGDGYGFRFAPPDGSSQNQSAAASSIYLDVIQTDAAINHGNSGGALVNTDGDIIGVNVAIASAASGTAGEDSGNIGVGFAIPIDYAKRVAEEIIEDGTASHGYLGVSVTPAAASNSSSSFTVGAEVAETVSGSPGAKAGLRAGDIITSLNGLPVTDAQSLTAAVRMQAAGSTVTIDYTRNGEAESTEATLGDSADQ